MLLSNWSWQTNHTEPPHHLSSSLTTHNCCYKPQNALQLLSPNSKSSLSQLLSVVPENKTVLYTLTLSQERGFRAQQFGESFIFVRQTVPELYNVQFCTRVITEYVPFFLFKSGQKIFFPILCRLWLTTRLLLHRFQWNKNRFAQN